MGAGIGLTTTLFSIVKGVIWTELAVPGVEQLVRVDAAPPLLSNYRSQQTTLQSMAALVATGVNAEVAGTPRRLQVAYVSPNFFDVLQVRPSAGAPQFQVRSERAVVISHRVWLGSFGGRSDALGSRLKLNGAEFTVTAVMPPGFGFPRSEDIWAAWEHDASNPVEARGRGSDAFLFGRLKEGFTVAQAKAEMNAIAQRLRTPDPHEPAAPEVAVVSWRDSNIKGEVRVLLTALLVCCFFVLLIACANVANLSLARAARRLHELGVRSALGASRKQLIGVLLSESLILSIIGAAAGVGFATGAIYLFTAELQKEAALTGGMPAAMNFEVDGLVLLFVSLLAVATALVSGLVPALRVTSMNLEQLVRGGGRAVTVRSGRFGKVLIHVQLAASVLLLVGTGVMGSMWARLGANVEYDPSKILTARIEVTGTEFPAPAQRALLFHKLQNELAHAPGVAAAALTTAEHLERSASANIVIEGRLASRSSDAVSTRWQGISSGYFDVFGAPLKSGRLFDGHDDSSTRTVAVVNQAFAKRHWPDGEAVGKRFRYQNQEQMPEWLTVVGVVGDIGSIKSAAPQNAPAFFRPLAQIDASEVTILVRSQTDASHALPIMSRIVKGLTTSPLFQVHTASEIKDMEAVGLRIPAMLFAVCGLSGLLLSAIGTYGVLSLAARQRTREIGIRLALGATPPTIFRSMVLQGSRQVAVGIATGLVGGLILTRVLYSLFASLQWLVGINVAVAAILAVVGMVAVAVPAFSASRLQPHIALRE